MSGSIAQRDQPAVTNTPTSEETPGYLTKLLRDGQALAFVVGAAVLANVLLLASPAVELAWVGALVLLVILPGHLFAESVFTEPGRGLLERRLLALGCGYVLAIFLMVALWTIFRPLQASHIIIGANGLNAALLALALREGGKAGLARLVPRLEVPSWQIVLLLSVAAPFRIWNIGHSEFQGDESLVLLRTMAFLQGVPDALIAHRKPPGEILLNAAFSGSIGTVTEQTARLTFAIAGIALILAFYRLGRAMFGPRVALVAALLLAVNGYFVAFSRILQYQSPGFLMEVLAVLCLYRFARKAPSQRSYAVVGGLLLAGAAMMGLNAIFLLPVAALALWGRVFGKNRASVADLACWFWPLALLLPTAVLAYLLPPRLSADSLDILHSWGYLGPRVGGSRPYFHLENLWLSFSHYASSPFTLVMLWGGVLVALAPFFERLWPKGTPVRDGRQASAAMLLWQSDRSSNLMLAGSLAVLVGLLVTTARRSLAWKLALVWMAGPLFTHLFLIRTPGTHYREIVPGLALLVAFGAVQLYDWVRSEVLRTLLVTSGIVLLVGALHFVYVSWIRPWPEYQLLYPFQRHPLDWTDVNIRSAGGTFGAARHHGWKTAAVLVDRGELPAAFTTNERPAQAAWYMKQSWICDEQARLYILSPRRHDARDAIEDRETIPGYQLAGQIYVGGRPTLSLLTRTAQPGGPRTYHSEDYEQYFDRSFGSPWIPVGNLYRPGLNSAPICPRQ